MPKSKADKNSCVLETEKMLEKYRQHVDLLLENGQKSFEKDHTKVGVGFGIFMIIIPLILSIFKEPDSFAITALAWGAVVMSLSLIIRYKSIKKQLAFTGLIINLEKVRGLLAHRIMVSQKIIRDGIPENFSAEHLRVLIGDVSQNMDKS